MDVAQPLFSAPGKDLNFSMQRIYFAVCTFKSSFSKGDLHVGGFMASEIMETLRKIQIKVQTKMYQISPKFFSHCAAVNFSCKGKNKNPSKLHPDSASTFFLIRRLSL